MTESIASLILSQLAVSRISAKDARTLYDTAGSALDIINNRNDIRSIIPDASDRLVEILSGDFSVYEQRAAEEQEWCNDNSVSIRSINDAEYPDRLRHCPDAPIVIFVRGKADLNAPHTINIVGTRKCTSYGQDFITHFVKDLAALCPDITINSGLAYGIDICAHRAALQNNVPTIGIVAHGQDTLYPTLHRKEANEMALGNGAIVTEYPRFTRPEARNFLQRNRIIAGMSDATIVVESASHGGGLVTARLALDYNREVFAVPGPVNAEYSKGCNNLIRDNKAQLITSAQDVVDFMNWQYAAQLKLARQSGIERSFFNDLSTDEQCIVDALQQHGDCQANVLSLHTGLTANALHSSLFSLEIRGIIKTLPGNTYHLIS